MNIFFKSALSGLALSLMLSLSACSDNMADTGQSVESTATSETASNSGRYFKPLWATGVKEILIQGRPALSLEFSTELDPFRSYSQWLSVYKQGKKRAIRSEWVLSEDARSLYFTEIEPKSSYTIRIKPGMVAKDKHVLSEEKTLTITTRHLDASVGFSGKGMIIPAGGDAGLPVRSINVEQISVDYFKVPTEKFQYLLSQFNTASTEDYYDINDLLSNAVRVYSADYELANETDTSIETKLPIDRRISDTPGIYFAVLRRDGVYGYSQSSTYFTVSDIGLHLRQYGSRWSIFASELSSGVASEEVKVRVLDSQGNVISEGETDTQGLVSLSVPAKKGGSLILALKGQQLALLNLGGPNLDMSEFDQPNKPFRQREYFIYGPRDVYRPGEQLEFSILFRDLDGQLLPATPISAELRRPDGIVANRQTLSPASNGYYQYSYALNDSAPTGQWALYVNLGDKTDVGEQKPFLVEDFMPERIRLGFSATADSILTESQLAGLKLQAEYLYGAPAAGNASSTTLIISLARKPFASMPGYIFGTPQSAGSNYYYYPEQTLDQNGEASLIPEDDMLEAIRSVNGPVRLRFRSSVFESGGRPIERSLQLYHWQKGLWPGLKATFDLDNNTLTNTDVRFKALVADANGIAQPQRKIKAELVKLNREYYWEYQEDDGWRYPYSEKPETVWAKKYVSAEQAIDIVAPVEKGYYELHLTDESGNSSTVAFKIGQDWWGYSNQGNDARPDKIKITLDQAAYPAGESVRFQLQAPRPGNGFLIVENSEGILYSQRISLGKDAQEFKIQIPEQDSNWRRHDLRIVALIAQPEAQARKGVPMRSLGIQPIPLDRSQRNIKLSLEAPARVEPQTRMRIKVFSDTPAQEMMLTLAAVDQGVLSVTDFETPDPFEYFYQPRYTNVQARDNFAEVLHLKDMAFARQRSGGDAEELSRAGERPESDILIVSLFKGPVQFDQNGVAEVEFDMPDFNGAVRIMAAAYAGDRFGSSDAEVLVKAPVVTQLSLPRFAAYGDQTRLTLDIQNTLEQSQTLQLKWEIDGAVLYQPSQTRSRVTLAKNQKQVISLPVIITRSSGVARIKLSVSSEQLSFERNWTLGLRPAYPAVALQKNRFLKEGESIAVDPQWLDGTIADSLQLQLSASPYPPLNTAEQWRSLLQYPYGCLEQTTSRARPLMMADEQVQIEWGVKLPEDLNRVEAIKNAINRLQTMQRPEGGFGLWDARSSEEYWLTAYVTDFLLSAQEKGFEVPQSMLKPALERLQYYVRNNKIPGDNFRWGDTGHRRFAYRSYAAFVLAKRAQAPLGTLREWFDRYDNQSRSPLPLAHLAIALKLQGDGQRAARAIVLAEQTLRTKDYLGDYGSEIRDTALLLKLNIEYQLSLSDVEQRLRHLSQLIYERGYLSTQERDAILQLALALSGDDKNAPWSARLNLAADTRPIESTDSWSRVFKGVDVPQISFDNTGARKIYASQTLIAQTVQAPEKQSNGLSIRRNWYDAEGNLITGNTFQTGDYVIVRLMVNSDTRTPDAMIVDLLPAGFELENPGLAHATPLSSFNLDGEVLKPVNSAYEGSLKHTEYRDDRFIAAVDINNYNTLELTYLMRAVTPGRYQVPSAFVEDMYQPEKRAIGSPYQMVIIKPK